MTMTPARTTPKTTAETLPRPADELDDLAAYYDTHDTAAEMEHGQWVDPRPMKTTSLRLPVDVVEALKARAQRRGVRYTALLREILERAARGEPAAEGEELIQINRRLARIEAALTGQPAQAPRTGRTHHAGGEA
jgi:predicted DNA binding CopG/RHH family protein